MSHQQVLDNTIVDPGAPSLRGPGLVVNTFGADSRRRGLYTLRSLPLAVGELTSVLVGRHHRAADRQRRVTGHLLAVPFDGRPVVDRWARVLGHAVLSIPLGVLGWLVLLLMVPNSLRNLAYPLVANDYSDAWGGSTLAGAWAVHAGLVLVMIPGWVWLMRGLTHLQGALARRLLGDGTSRWALPAAVLAAAAGMVFLLALIHQL